MWGVGGKGRGSSLQEKTLHTYTFRLDWSRNFILYQKKKKKEKKGKRKLMAKPYMTQYGKSILYLFIY